MPSALSSFKIRVKFKAFTRILKLDRLLDWVSSVFLVCYTVLSLQNNYYASYFTLFPPEFFQPNGAESGGYSV